MVDTESKRHGGELVASVLKAHNIKEVFTLCGGHISPILVACENLGINIYDTRHEVTCVFAADAVARLRQDLGVAAVTSGPGITNTITALKNAQMAESPVLLIGGAAPSMMKGRGALQDIDQMSLVSSLCKYSARITRVSDIVPTLREAIAAAKSDTPGPVFVEFPLDVLQPYGTVAKEMTLPKNSEEMKKNYLENLFGNAFIPQDVNPLPVQIPQPDESAIKSVVEMIMQAKKPLLLMGSQATLAPVEPNELVKTVENLGIPVYLGGMSRGLLGPSSPLQMRQNRKDALKEADVVILAGAVCDFRLTYGSSFSPSSKIVSINRSREQMFKNHGLYWQSAATLQADVGLSLVAIQKGLESQGWKGASKEWVQSLRVRDDAKEANVAKKISEKPADGYMNPLLLLNAIDKKVPKNAILVADGGDFVGSSAYIIRPGGPLQWLDPGAFGTLGVGAGFALGAKAVYPDRPVVIIWGDGACGYSVVEYDTFVRHKLPVLSIVGNDACWTQIAREQIPRFKSAVACNLEYTKYEVVAEGLGAEGVLVDKGQEDKIEQILEDAVNRSKNESVVVNVLIGKTNFREGSISV